ncbi:MAG TPA: PQQ-dependent sugar dehydrogenase [Gemmatimonadota bacterium]|jgi:glucose/arabinose dehydrogenase
MAVLALLLLLLVQCNGDGGNGVGPPPPPPPPPPSPPPPGAAPALREVVSGLSAPLYLTSPPGDSRLFVVEQGGRIKIIRNGQVLATPFLDVGSDISTGGERGLLSLAFHPDYASNGRFFIYFTAGNGDLRVVEYRVSADPDRAVPNAVRTILSVDHRRSNHNGGLLLFGPDRKLYAGLGDGGGAGDPDENGQDRSVLLGKLLRLDVDAGVPYAIPPGNPFAGQAGARGEIWAFGLRNPWRYSFDRQTGDLYIADVGQGQFEEVNAAPGNPGGLNYGWDLMEGLHCFEPSSGCDRSGLTLPVLEYSHADGCSVTGGYVYRGSAVPSLSGTYFYSDFCTGFVRSFRLAGGTATDQRSWPDLEADLGAANVTSFGEDSGGELYIVTSGGRIFEFVAE